MPETQKRRITAEDLYRFKLISGARIAPNGKQVIYAVQRVDEKTEKKYSNLWMADSDGQVAPRQYTYGDQSDSTPRWSPDGQWIAFLSNRGETEKPAQLYLLPTFGGEARRLTHLEAEIQEFAWSPDGKRLVCAVLKMDAEAVEREKDEQKKKLGIVSRRYERLFYKLDGYGYLPHERLHLWSVDVETGEAKQLTDHPIYDEHYPAWSPDGKWLAFISNRSQDPDFYPDQDDLFVMASDGSPSNSTPSEGGAMRCIPTPVGAKLYPSFSPDGQWIAYHAQDGLEGYKNLELWIVPTDGSQPPCNLTRAYDLHTDSSTINDQGEPEFIAPIWSADGNTIYFHAVYHGSTVLKSISVNGANLQSVVDEGGVVTNFSLDQSQRWLAYGFGSMSDVAQVHLRDLQTGEDRQLTRINRDWLDEIDLGSVEEVWFKGPDGNDLQGWILKPPDFDPHKKYPSIMEIHGGPMTEYGNFFMHEFYYLAASGYVVYFSNPRGGRGYGEAHTQINHGNWGDRDYADLMAWVDYAERLPYIDTNRMGVTGGSYGGYMSVWIIGHTNRFKAAVTQRCVSNFVSMWGSSDFNWVFQRELNDKAPFEDLKYFWDHSPIAYIGNAKTPTLVIHNENDLRCPIEQGEQVFVALKRLGVDTAFVRFPDEFHGLSRTGRTDRRIIRLQSIKGWFDKYL